MKFATEILRASDKRYDKCIIYVDSQPAIKGIVKPARQSGQAVIQEVLNCIESLQNEQRNLSISLTWVPWHMGILGNEKTDEVAKEAAKSFGTAEETLFKYYTPKSSCVTTIEQVAINKWTKSTAKWETKRETFTKHHQTAKSRKQSKLLKRHRYPYKDSNPCKTTNRL